MDRKPTVVRYILNGKKHQRTVYITREDLAIDYIKRHIPGAIDIKAKTKQVTIGQLVKKNHIFGSFAVIEIRGNDLKIENIDTTAQEWVTLSQIRLA